MDWINSLSSFGGYAVLAGILLWMQFKQDEWTRKYMDEMRKSIDRLTDAIKNGGNENENNTTNRKR